jgi:hypothetical protein
MKKSWRIWRCEKLGKGVYNYCEAVVEFLGFMVIINENEKKKKKKVGCINQHRFLVRAGVREKGTSNLKI